VGTPPVAEKTSPDLIEQNKPLSYLDLGEFSVNTSDVGEPHFIKVNVQLGYEENNVEYQTLLNKMRPLLRDNVISVIGAKKYDDLDTQDKREELKTELKNKINAQVLGGSRVQITRVVFTEFVIT
jgi:flagellar FliL protein